MRIEALSPNSGEFGACYLFWLQIEHSEDASGPEIQSRTFDGIKALEARFGTPATRVILTASEWERLRVLAGVIAGRKPEAVTLSLASEMFGMTLLIGAGR